MAATRHGLTNAEFNDLELLGIVHDLTDTDSGWARADLVASRCGVTHPNPIRCVSGRMAWMGRYGAVERNPEHPYEYRLTELGEALIGKGGRLSRAQERAIEQSDERQLLRMVDKLGGRWLATADPSIRTLSRRQWQHLIAQAKR